MKIRGLILVNLYTRAAGLRGKGAEARTAPAPLISKVQFLFTGFSRY